MAKIQVSETLHKAVDTALQLLGARDYRRIRRSSGCTATLARLAWWMVRPRYTGWSSPGSIWRVDTNSGDGQCDEIGDVE
jgi:hypothetical protein